jgi:hypothetical protein
MNSTTMLPTMTSMNAMNAMNALARHERAERLQDQFGKNVTRRLSQGAADVPHDISERLRVGREQAMARRKKPVTASTSQVNSRGGAATLTLGGGEHLSLWERFASIIPLIALAIGLIMINAASDDNRANELAEVDSALLVDNLPPSAYADPGFTQFLKLNRDVPQ